MAGRNDMGTDFDAGTVQVAAKGSAWGRLKAVGQWVLHGAETPFFGPGQPLQPAAQEEAKGRTWDYPFAVNMQTQPKQGEGNPYALLRGLADNCDVLRLVIETRKDQICKLDWRITPRDEKKTQGPDALALEEFFRMPDREHTWDAWLRMLLEDLFVIDAPVIYPRRTRGGGLYSLDPVDGATINRLLDADGRTPIPPDPAYQQRLKGLPAVDYTADELIFMPRNPRTNKIYGFSPVEQIVMTINMAIRRAVHQLQYYTEGSAPDLIWGVPDGWNPDQIAQFQAYWDSLLAGNSANRRKGLFVPSGVKPINTKEEVLKDEFDEWLARVVCFCFSIPPTPFVKQVNRATAQTAQEASVQEGLHPLMKWVVGLMDGILAKHVGRDDLCFKWQVEEEVDPLTKAQIHSLYVQEGVLDVNEVREEMGRPALTPEQLEARKPAAPALPQDGQGGAGGDDGGEEPPKGGKKPQKAAGEDDGAEKLAKADTSREIKPVPFERRDVKRTQTALAGALAKWLTTEAESCAAEAEAAYNAYLGKAAVFDENLAAVLLDAMDWLRWDQVVIIVRPHLEVVADSTGLRALMSLPLDQEMVEVATPQVEDAAVSYARRRSAELVGRQYNALGKLVANPSARWAITDSTRAALRAEIEKNLAEGADPRALAQAIRESAQFGKARATLIARTELIMAHNAANLESFKQAAALGLDVKKQWVTAHDDRVSPDCVANEVAGIIGLDEAFPSGQQAPPCHPGCRCNIAPVVK